jgi:hypothetical protein
VNLGVFDGNGYDGRRILDNQYDEYVDLSCHSGNDADDPWGVDMFYSQFDTDPYGVEKEQLRTTLDELFITNTPLRLRVGLPFLVFVSIGLVFSLLFGNVLLLNF